jgi:dienelactone hydrolase
MFLQGSCHLAHSLFRTVRRAILAVLLALTPIAATAQAVSLGLPRDTVLLDEKISITLTNLAPNRAVTLHLMNASDEGRWRSSATFLSDRAGRIDLTRMAPIAGSYSGVDAMGLFWSAQLDPSVPRLASSQAVTLDPAPQSWELRAEEGGLSLATDTVWRRAVKRGVRVTRVREQGLVGAFYQPTGGAPSPGIIVLSGAGGGLPTAAQQPGGLASRGFSVLSLAYFAGEGLPPQLSRIKLEYFKTAIDWLRAQQGVDPGRIGVLGISRGGEVALLLGATYPQIKAVVAYVPSHVVWAGCCDSVSQADPAWMLGGKPVPHMPPAPEIRRAISALSRDVPVRRTPMVQRRLEDTIAVANAAIPVERINGPVLLITGHDDQVWPSFFMAEQIMARLRRHAFKHTYRHVAYSGAGHSIGRPYTSTMDINNERHPITKRLYDSGGTPSATAWAREDSWSKLLEFLEKYLRSASQN